MNPIPEAIAATVVVAALEVGSAIVVVMEQPPFEVQEEADERSVEPATVKDWAALAETPVLVEVVLVEVVLVEVVLVEVVLAAVLVVAETLSVVGVTAEAVVAVDQEANSAIAAVMVRLVAAPEEAAAVQAASLDPLKD